MPSSYLLGLSMVLCFQEAVSMSAPTAVGDTCLAPFARYEPFLPLLVDRRSSFRVRAWLKTEEISLLDLSVSGLTIGAVSHGYTLTPFENGLFDCKTKQK
jgi:hypothetical protein